MAIEYSLFGRYIDTREKEKGRKVYAHAQITGKMSLYQFAEHICSHGSVYHVADVAGVLTTAVECLREQLLLGMKVELGYMGEFSITLHCTGADDEESFSTKDNIKSIEVKWDKGDKFVNMLQDATFRYMGTREQQKANKKVNKEEVHDSIYNYDGSEGTDSSDSATGGTTDSGNTGSTGSSSGDSGGGDDEGTD